MNSFKLKPIVWSLMVASASFCSVDALSDTHATAAASGNANTQSQTTVSGSNASLQTGTSMNSSVAVAAQQKNTVKTGDGITVRLDDDGSTDAQASSRADAHARADSSAASEHAASNVGMAGGAGAQVSMTARETAGEGTETSHGILATLKSWFGIGADAAKDAGDDAEDADDSDDVSAHTGARVDADLEISGQEHAGLGADVDASAAAELRGGVSDIAASVGTSVADEARGAADATVDAAHEMSGEVEEEAHAAADLTVNAAMEAGAEVSAEAQSIADETRAAAEEAEDASADAELDAASELATSIGH